MSNTFPSFSINDGDWVRVRQFIQHVSTIELRGGGSLVPYTGAIDKVDLGNNDIATLGDFTSPKGTGTIWGNEAFGKNSLNSVTTGDYNTAFGSRALEALTIGHSNTAVGRKAGVSITDGDFNTAVGFAAMQSGTTGGKNVAVGAGSLALLTSGESNFACGYAALALLTTGNNNIGLGAESLYTVTTQDFNTAIGSSALRNVAATRCTAVGYSAGKTCGENSIAVGVSAGYVMGTNSVAIGCWAGYTTTLNNNIFIGHEAGRLNEGAGNIFLGYQAGRAETGSNKLYIHNSDSVTPLIHGDFSTPAITFNGSITAGTAGVSTDYDVNFYGHHDGTYDYILHWDAATASLWVGKSNNSVGGSFNFVSGGTNTLLLNYNILTGLANNVNGSYNAVFGRIHAITSNYALVGGYLNTVNNQYAFAAGRNNTVSYSAGAIGRGNTASGNYSFSVGYLNSSTGIEAMSFGLSNNADHSVAIMIGNSNSSTGNYAYCIGNGNSAGLSSAAIGYQNTASGNYSISIGRENLSSGANAVTLGRDLTASADTAIAIGRAITNATEASVKIGITNSLFFGTVSSIRLNDDGVDIDVVIEGDTDVNLLHTDASTDRVGIGIAVPLYKLHVSGTLASDTHTITAPTTTDYLFTTRSTKDTLAIQSQTAGTKCVIELFTKDGDGSDEVTFRLFAQGTPENTTNLEDLDVRYDPGGPYYVIRSFAAGFGTLHPIWLGCGAYTDQLVLNNDGNVGVNTATPDSQFEVNGESRFGSSASDYAQFSTDGLLTLIGNARVKKRIPIPLTAIKTGAVDPPSEGSVDGFRTLDFDGGTKDEEVFKPFCGPLDWSSGTGATLDLRFFVDTAPTTPANVVWQIEIKSIACDGTVDFSSGTSTYTHTVAITTGTPANDKKLHCSELTIPAGDLIEGGCLFIRLHRDATHASDTFTGDARLLKAFITYVADKLGTQYSPE